MKRIVVRLVGCDRNGAITQVLEQEIEATRHAICLLLRRDPFKNAISYALINNGIVKFEVKK